MVYLEETMLADNSESRMEPLVTNRQCLVWLCICPADKSTSRWQKAAHAISAATALSGLIAGFASETAFAWKFISIDAGQAMYALTFMSGELAVFYMALVGMIFQRHKIDKIFINLSAIYKASE